MKTGKILLVLTVFAAGLFASCKKNDSTTTYASFSGSARILGNVPKFVRAGDTYTLKTTGISRSDGGDYGIYWYNSIYSDYRDTTKKIGQAEPYDFEFEVPDTMSTISVRCVYFASGYYTSTASVNAVIVGPRSLKGQSFVPSQGFVDKRDDKVYHFTKAGGLDWMAENLAYGEKGGVYFDSPVMETVLGRYYTWTDAQNACPEGWRLPTEADWDALCGDGKGVVKDLISKAEFNYEPMWDYWPVVGDASLKHGFEALPAGYATFDGTKYSFPDESELAVFWTSDEADAKQGVYKYLHEKNPDLMTGRGDKDSFAASVRCVR